VSTIDPTTDQRPAVQVPQPIRPRDERRRSPRAPLRLTVSLEHEGQRLLAFAEDLSTQGLFLRSWALASVRDLRPGTHLVARFTLPNTPDEVETVLRVVRASDARWGSAPGAGLHFAALTDDDRAAIGRAVGR
jgi:hypothetical protein